MTSGTTNTWPLGYEREKTLKISTIGRKTGRTHTKTVQFAVDQTGRFFVATKDSGRDWVKNAKKNPLVSVKVRNATRSMRAVPLSAESDKDYVRRLYRRKYFMIKLLELLGQSRSSKYGAFELISA